MNHLKCKAPLRVAHQKVELHNTYITANNSASTLICIALQLDADVTILSTTLTEGTTCADASIAAGPSHSQPIPPPPLPAQQYAAPFDAASGHVSHLLVRLRSDKQRPQEIRIAVIGNVDSGKSTMVGVLTRSMLDDGRGAARSKVFKHDHEGATGRTSAIGQHNLCLHSAGGILNDAKFKNSTCSDYVKRASKVVTFVDLAGHERYFKTTAYGLTGHLPDYACLLVGANAGVVGMCKEHLGVALALKVPVFFVVTKVDICPEHILKQSLQQLSAVLKRPGVRKRPFLINSVTVRLVAHPAMPHRCCYLHLSVHCVSCFAVSYIGVWQTYLQRV
jgi:GTPase